MDGLAGATLTREEVKAGWGDWLSRDWTWDWWVTLTFDQPRAAGTAPEHTGVGWALSAQRWDDWLETVEVDAGLGAAYWLRGREPNPYRYGTHFHALMGGVASASRRRAHGRWLARNGFNRIVPYDPRRGAGWYVSKYVIKELGDIQFSSNLGQRRKENNGHGS